MPDSRIPHSVKVNPGDVALGKSGEMVEVGQEKSMGPGKNEGNCGDGCAWEARPKRALICNPKSLVTGLCLSIYAYIYSLQRVLYYCLDENVYIMASQFNTIVLYLTKWVRLDFEIVLCY